MIIRHNRLGLRASLFLSVMAGLLLTLATTAAGAQAAEWEIGGAGLAHQGLHEESIVSSSQYDSFRLNSEVGSIPIEIGCSDVSSTGSIIEGGEGTQQITLDSCTLDEPAVLTTRCHIEGPVVLNAHGQLIEVGNRRYYELSPQSGESFGTFWIEGCVLEGGYGITGNLVEQNGIGGGRIEQQFYLSPEISAAAGVSGEFGWGPMTVSGRFDELLSGPHAGSKWGEYYPPATPGWRIEGAPILGQASVEGSGGPISIDFQLWGSPVGIECQESGSSGILFEGSTGEETMTFDGCAVTSSPIGCELERESLRTEDLQISEEESPQGRMELHIQPTEGLFLSVPLVGCGAEGEYEMWGSFSAEGNVQGVERVEQPFELSAEEDLFIGNGPATISGLIFEHLAGANEGSPWGATSSWW